MTRINGNEGNSMMYPDKGNVPPKKETITSQSSLFLRDTDGKVDDGDIGFKSHLHTSTTYQAIRDFIKEHVGEKWTPNLMSKIQDLINKYNKEAAEKATTLETTTTVVNGRTIVENREYDKNGKLIEGYILEYDEKGDLVDDRDLDTDKQGNNAQWGV